MIDVVAIKIRLKECVVSPRAPKLQIASASSSKLLASLRWPIGCQERRGERQKEAKAARETTHQESGQSVISTYACEVRGEAAVQEHSNRGWTHRGAVNLDAGSFLAHAQLLTHKDIIVHRHVQHGERLDEVLTGDHLPEWDSNVRPSADCSDDGHKNSSSSSAKGRGFESGLRTSMSAAATS